MLTKESILACFPYMLKSKRSTSDSHIKCLHTRQGKPQKCNKILSVYSLSDFFPVYFQYQDGTAIL